MDNEYKAARDNRDNRLGILGAGSATEALIATSADGLRSEAESLLRNAQRSKQALLELLSKNCDEREFLEFELQRVGDLIDRLDVTPLADSADRSSRIMYPDQLPKKNQEVRRG